ncbi:MAG: FHA domain-containing protein [Phormidium sp.]
MPKIIAINLNQPQEIKEINLTPEKMLNRECIVGRDRRCCVVLDDPLVSSLHGKIYFENGQYYYSDTSRNGSHINNKIAEPKQSYILRDRDTIQIGHYALMIQSLAEDSSVVPRENSSNSPNDYMPLAMIEPSSINRWNQGKLKVKCVQVVDETSDVKTFRFVAIPPVLFTYKPGQFISLDLEINGKEVSRCYSISSSPSRPHSLEITVKRIPDGLVSNWLHNNIKVGSEVQLSSPMGDFTFFAHPTQKLLLISAGSGITPMMSMARWICDTGSDIDVVFLHSSRTPDDIIFRRELELMAARHLNFHLAITTTKLEFSQVWLGYKGRVNESMLISSVPDFGDRTIYVCGPEPFMQGIKTILEKLEFPRQNFFKESFGLSTQEKSQPEKITVSAPTSRPLQLSLSSMLSQLQPDLPKLEHTNGNRATLSPTTSSSPATVVFTKSGKEVIWDGEKSILELAEQENVAIRRGCGKGFCGACKQKLLSGNVEYKEEPRALQDSDRSVGLILTCIAEPVEKVVIDA